MMPLAGVATSARYRFAGELPAITDFVPFPTSHCHRCRSATTKHALDQVSRHRKVALVAHRDDTVDDPRFGDIYEVACSPGCSSTNRRPIAQYLDAKRLFWPNAEKRSISCCHWVCGADCSPRLKPAAESTVHIRGIRRSAGP